MVSSCAFLLPPCALPASLSHSNFPLDCSRGIEKQCENIRYFIQSRNVLNQLNNVLHSLVMINLPSLLKIESFNLKGNMMISAVSGLFF